jgi:hypothetical protein
MTIPDEDYAAVLKEGTGREQVHLDPCGAPGRAGRPVVGIEVDAWMQVDSLIPMTGEHWKWSDASSSGRVEVPTESV